jgi:hypothetical protein
VRPYTRIDKKGRTIGRDDIHHGTADQPRKDAKRSAKSARHGARQHARGELAATLRQNLAAGAE